MKIWMNFVENDIKRRIKGFKEGDDFEDQIIYESKLEKEDCSIEFLNNNEVEISFGFGNIRMTAKEFGELFGK
jgi:hypothetical protein